MTDDCFYLFIRAAAGSWLDTEDNARGDARDHWNMFIGGGEL